jgi:2'-5' RNA ligase
MKALTSATSPAPDCRLKMGRLGSFSDRRGPRVVWAAVDGVTPADRDALYRLQERIETWLESAGFARERRFSPHLTLARVPDQVTPDQRKLIAESTATSPEPDLTPLTVTHVSLMRSHLGPGGSRYERIASFPD